MSNKRCFCIDISKKPTSEMCRKLKEAINKCPESTDSDSDSDVEGFDCQEICTGESNKSFLDSNETKNILLIFSLICFYLFMKR